MNTQPTHIVLRASAAHRWIPCPGSIEMSRGIPDSSSPAAVEGSAAHCVAANLLDGKEADSEMLYEVKHDRLVWPSAIEQSEYPGPLRLNEDICQLDDAMFEHAQAYADYCNAIPGQHFTEVRVSYEKYVEGGYGTSDHIVIGDGVMDVIDLKYGRGVMVNAENNEQGLLYALGAYLEFEYLMTSPLETVRIHIYQPRRDHISVAEYTLDQLLAFAEVAREASELASQPVAPLVPGDKQCQWCPASGVCPARTEQSMRIACREFDVHDTAINKLQAGETLTPKDHTVLGPDELGLLLEQIPAIESWCAAVREATFGCLMTGLEVPGFKIVEGRSNRKWTSEENAERVLRGLCDDETNIHKRTLISPSQAEKLLGKKIPDLESVITKPKGKPSIVATDDPRPDYVFTDGGEFK